MTKELTYFDNQGNWGDAAGLTVVDTTDFDAHDWEALEYTLSAGRTELAQTIRHSKDYDRRQTELRARLAR